ncbi:type I-E CRISPR-associated protein Cas5/CasD [Actinokineospora globicatena]|uniref:Type I-E CRISPR-associated protein Cas5/CasD n=1 Tax=Actinokineospora globicatena TaxID=103729 RepID=A0A9W6V4Z0_9PSEU|nr:type I-E CRISPR-associated protein Cas5/CasD [Actinokineospora globicatena]GLW89750.1 type I-E CRISPR-associated protein Cas5/CasD [Actinokineospora globicatena]
MTALVLRLAAPLQSWGTSSRFTRRGTDRQPSRSGVIGLLAAAQGRRRTDSIEDLMELRIGVRADQPGLVEREFQTARTRDGSAAMPLSERYYLADAVFAAAIEAPPALLEGLREALRRPVFPLFLGRRSCPPAGKLDHGLHEGSLDEVLTRLPWLASRAVQQACKTAVTPLMVTRDCAPDTPGSQVVHDDPLTFDHRHRQYGWRSVVQHRVEVPNPTWVPPVDTHDPMDLLGEPV